MRYERSKNLLALLSLTSVFITLLVATWANSSQVSLDSVTSVWSWAAVTGAVASVFTVFISRQLAAKRRKQRVFLIYAREDLDSARHIAEVLREHGFSPWLDVDEINPGEVWQKAVARAIEESAIALVLVSPHLSKKGFVQRELKLALDTLQEQVKDVSPVVPVRLDEAAEVPDELKHVQWVNLFEDAGMEKLVSGLTHMLVPRAKAH